MALALMAVLLLSASGARAAAGRKMLEEDAWAPAPGPSGESTYGYDSDMVMQDGGMGMKMADDMDMAADAVVDALVGAMVDPALAPGKPPLPLQLQLRRQCSLVSLTTSEPSRDCEASRLWHARHPPHGAPDTALTQPSPDLPAPPPFATHAGPSMSDGELPYGMGDLMQEGAPEDTA
jgi:hypothetical protein